ncbi:MAG: MBL fold metallo-hydrolase [Alphaproteobacteria bacterium]|nr:MBL fold metallo-hydrolase [Alphaproteobacteria bacterium]
MNSLFARDVTFAVLSSGSGGNCTYVGDGSAGVLIDCGVSTKQIFKRMESIGLADAPIDAVLITHEHTDHVGSASVLCRQLLKRAGKFVPFYMTEGTLEGAPDQCVPDSAEVIEAGVPFRVRHIEVDPFTVPHDVIDPVAFRLQVGDASVGVLTDLGRPTALVAGKLRGLHALALEYNHDIELLLEGPYPWHLKQRIRSNHGHLSNDQASDLLKRTIGDSLQHLVLAHLSEKNNSPAKAMASANRALREVGAEHVQVTLAEQHAAAEPIRVRTQAW